MFNDDDEGIGLKLELSADEGVSPAQLGDAREFFISMLESSEQGNLDAYNLAEAHFREHLAKFKERSKDGTLDEETVLAGKRAFDDMIAAKERLQSSLNRVAYAMSHTAFA